MAAKKVPQVNLIERSRAVPGPPRAPRLMEVVLIVFAVAIWAIVGVAVALLLGWHPQLALRL